MQQPIQPIQQPVQVARGTTHTINVNLVDKAGEEYFLGTNEVLRFAVKRRPEEKEAELTKDFGETEFDEEGRCYVLILTPDDTANLKLGRHFYGIAMQSGEDFVPVVDTSIFDVVPIIPSRREDNV